jgi:hypothetical protein
MLPGANAGFEVLGDSLTVVKCGTFRTDVAANDLIACGTDEIEAQAGLHNFRSGSAVHL